MKRAQQPIQQRAEPPFSVFAHMRTYLHFNVPAWCNQSVINCCGGVAAFTIAPYFKAYLILMDHLVIFMFIDYLFLIMVVKINYSKTHQTKYLDCKEQTIKAQ